MSSQMVIKLLLGGIESITCKCGDTPHNVGTPPKNMLTVGVPPKGPQPP